MQDLIAGQAAEMAALAFDEAAMTADDMVASVQRQAAEMSARVGDTNLFEEIVTPADLALSLDRLAAVAAGYAARIRSI